MNFKFVCNYTIAGFWSKTYKILEKRVHKSLNSLCMFLQTELYCSLINLVYPFSNSASFNFIGHNLDHSGNRRI